MVKGLGKGNKKKQKNEMFKDMEIIKYGEIFYMSRDTEQCTEMYRDVQRCTEMYSKHQKYIIKISCLTSHLIILYYY